MSETSIDFDFESFLFERSVASRIERLSSEEVEAELRRRTPVIVNSFNQLTYLRNTLEWLSKNQFKTVYVLDQASTYQPLLDYYQSSGFGEKYTVLRLKENLGPRALWEHKMFRGFPGVFIFTDPDLGLPVNPAPDFVSRMLSLSDKHRISKVGLALDISDHEKFQDVFKGNYEYEMQFWQEELEKNTFRAKIDTTFHLCNMKFMKFSQFMHSKRMRYRFFFNALRLAGDGFVAKHLPWYVDHGMPQEERDFYFETATVLSSVKREEAKAKRELEASNKTENLTL